MTDDSSPTNHHKPSRLRRIGRGLRQLFGLRNGSTLEESLNEAIEEHEEHHGAPIEQEQRTMLQNVLTFNELTVDDVLVPRGDIDWIEANISFEELQQKAVESGHTRLPVCRDVLDDVAGFVHVKDIVSILVNKQTFVMDDILRHLLFVPPSMKVSILLLKMQLSRVHMAIVVDEYGGTMGLVTLEDLVEEIVGEIEDEHDVEDGQLIMQTGRERFEASARLPIDELEAVVGISVAEAEREGDYDTLGGLLFSEFGYVPVVGEVVSLTFGGTQLECEILDADPRRIKRVLFRRKQLKAPETTADE